MTSGSRSSPAITSAGSPGSNCCSENIRIDTKNSVGISCRIRLLRKFSIGHAKSAARGAWTWLKIAATSFPPPLWGRDREARNPTGFWVCGALHPNPPHKGREQRNSSRSLSSLELQPDHAHQPVRHLLVAFELGGVRNQNPAVVDVKERLVLRHRFGQLLVDRLALRHVGDESRIVERLVGL